MPRASDSEGFVRDEIETPLGALSIVANAAGQLCLVGFHEGHVRMERQLRGLSPESEIRRARDPFGFSASLRAYFAGDLHAIDDLPVAMRGTEFQLRVWNELRKIPCGETWSYGALARRIGNPAAVRAVGLANGANPVGIVVPCHRVIGADGSLTGYGGGMDRKRWLLAHERRAGRALELPFRARG